MWNQKQDVSSHTNANDIFRESNKKQIKSINEPE